MRGLLLGFVLGVLVACGAAYYYFASGMAPAAVADAPMPFERKVAHMALDAHIEKQGNVQSPVPADEPNFLAGVIIYGKECAVCHGLPNHPSEFDATMYPHPPQLFKGKGVSDDPASETYWKVVNGIRLTGMPSFKAALDNTQSWQVSQLLAHSNELPDSVKKALAETAAPPTATK